MPKIKKTKKTQKKATSLVALKPAKKTNLPAKTKQKIRDTEKKKILNSWKQIGLSLSKIIDQA